MKTITCSFLIIISLLQLMDPVNSEETLDSFMRRLNRALNRREHPPATVPNSLFCTTIKASGTLASCPTAYGSDVLISYNHAGMTVTGCSCGFACGSWNVQNENVCQCLCPIIDWTLARCCKLRN